MVSIASARLHTLTSDVAASDMWLDQVDKPTSVASPSTWIEACFQFCKRVLSTMSALLTGSLFQGKKKPTFVDTACQTDEMMTELTVNHDWRACDVEAKIVIDDEIRSSTTETTEVYTDDESDDDLLCAICDLCESSSRVQSDCEIQAEPAQHLLRFTANGCIESVDVRPLVLQDYLCTCGECPQYKQIARDVAVTVKARTRHTKSITRLLQASSTYNELRGYHIDMIPAARECLAMWCGDEDKAFQSFVTLYDEASQVCG